MNYNVLPGVVAPACNSNTDKEDCEFQVGLKLDPISHG